MPPNKPAKKQQVVSDVVKELLDLTPAQRLALETDQVTECPGELLHRREPIESDSKVLHRLSAKPLKPIH